MRQYRKELIICLALAVTAVLVFGQVRDHEFINLGDIDYITENPYVSGGWSREGVTWAFNNLFSNRWHPVTWLSHMIDVTLFGIDPGSHHMVNLLFHLANTLLLFIVFRRMTGAIWQSAFVAALFALHPLHVESVVWVADRKDLLYGLAWILALWAYAGYARRPGRLRYLLVAGLFIIGFLAKPMMITLPIVLFCLDYWPLHRLGKALSTAASEQPARQAVSLGKALLEKAGLFAIVLTSLAAILALGGFKTIDLYGSWASARQVAVSLVSYMTYICKMFLPTDLSLSYMAISEIPPWQAIGSGLFLAVVTAAVIRWGRKRPYLPVGWFWYLVTLIPVIGLVPFGPDRIADRYTYIPLVGLFVMITWGVSDLLATSPTRKKLLPLAAALVLAACMIGSQGQTARWKNDYILFSHSVKVVADNPVLYYNLGVAASANEQPEEAISAFEEAIRLDPRLMAARNQLGILLSKEGRTEEAQVQFQEVVKIGPKKSETAYNIGLSLMKQGKMEAAQRQFEEVLRINPDNEGAHNTLGVLLTEQKRYDEARRHFSESLRVAPQRPEAQYNMGLAYMYEANIAEAKTHFKKAIDINPDHDKAHLYLGKLLVRERDLDGALVHFNEVLRINPDDSQAHHATGTILLGKGEMEPAKEHLTAALELNPNNTEVRRLLEGIEKEEVQQDQAASQPGFTNVPQPLLDDPRVSYENGLKMVRSGRLEEAREAFEKILETNPGHSGAHYNLGVIAARQKRLDESTAHFSKALEFSPKDAQIHNNLGAVLAQQRRFDEAIDQFSEALKIDPKDTKAKQNLALARRLKKKAEKRN